MTVVGLLVVVVATFAQERFPRLRQRRQARMQATGAVELRPATQCGGELNLGYSILTFSSGLRAAVWYPTTQAESKLTYANNLTTGAAQNAPVANCSTYPLVVFSHGFGGCGTQSVFFTEELARHGYIVVAPDHADAKCKVDEPRSGRGFGRADEPFRQPEKWTDKTYADRARDIRLVIDEMTTNREFGLRIDKFRIGGVGHSLGGYTMLGLAGGWESWRDNRIRAILLFSPYVAPFHAQNRLKAVRIPVMYQGGQRDLGITPQLRRQGGVYDESNRPKYYIELPRAGHFAWTVRSCGGTGSVSRCAETNTLVRTINEYGISFLDEYLKGQRKTLAREAGQGQNVVDYRSAP